MYVKVTFSKRNGALFLLETKEHDNIYKAYKLINQIKWKHEGIPLIFGFGCFAVGGWVMTNMETAIFKGKVQDFTFTTSFTFIIWHTLQYTVDKVVVLEYK